MTTDGHLGLSLVDNPVAGGDDMHGLDQGDEQEPLAALPDHLRRVGDLLSTADGASTPLYKALFALLLALPWHWATGGGIHGGSDATSGFDLLANGDWVGAVGPLGVGFGFLITGPSVLHTLRLTTRKHGSLAQLGF